MIHNLRHKINKIIVQNLLNIWINVPGKLISDILFLKVYYFLNMNEKLDLVNPSDFTQKLQYLKLRNTDDLCTKMVDKHDVKMLVAQKIGSEHVVPLLGVWSKFEDLDFSALPDKFVLKTTHDSGNVFICTDKNTTDFSFVKKKFEKALKVNYFYKSREYPYRNVTPRIIAEAYLSSESSDLLDYKFFCFHGRAEFLQISGKVNGQSYVSYYDLNFNMLPFTTNSLEAYNFEPPEKFDKMVEIANMLSEDFVHLRVDLYCVYNKVYFGEFTFHNCGGIMHFKPRYWNEKIGDLLKI